MLSALALVIVLPLAVIAQDLPSKKPVDQTDRLLAVLHEKKVSSFGDESIKLMTLGAVKDKLEKEFKDDGLKIVIREDLFRIKFPERELCSLEKFKIDVKPNGLTLHEFLAVALLDLNATYVLRRKHLEITTKDAANPFLRQLETLHEIKVSSFGEASIKDMTLGALKDKLEREFKIEGLKIVVREDLFRLQYPDKESYAQEKFKGDLKPNGLTLHEVLTLTLADINAVYLVRQNFIEITTPQAAVAECFKDGQKEKTPLPRLRREPLVSHHAHNDSFLGTVKILSARYGRPVVIDPEVKKYWSMEFGEPSDGYVSANWTNVPFPTAIRLLALDAGLDVKDTGGVLTITKPGPKKKGK